MNLSKLPWRYRVISMLAAVAFMLSLLWPFVTPLFKEFSSRELGPMLASTVYQPPGTEPVMVRVMQSGNSRNPVYEILFNDLLSSKLLVQPQRIDYGRQGPLPGAALQRFTDGSIFLIISGDQLWRLNPQQHQFEPFTESLATRHPQQLGGGIRTLDFAGPEWPDSFVLSNQEGQAYELHWASQQIYPQGGSFAAVEQHEFSSASGRYVDLAELSGAPVQQGKAPVMAVLAYQQKGGPGGLEYHPPLQLQFMPPVMEQVAPELVKKQTQSFRFEKMLWAISRLELSRFGIEDFTAVEPRMPRYNGRVLARNSERMLIAYELDNNQLNVKILELINTRTAMSVWNQAVSNIKPLAGNDNALSAQPYAGGFYLRSDNERPAMVMDNEGKLVHDFSKTERSWISWKL